MRMAMSLFLASDAVFARPITPRDAHFAIECSLFKRCVLAIPQFPEYVGAEPPEKFAPLWLSESLSVDAELEAGYLKVKDAFPLV